MILKWMRLYSSHLISFLGLVTHMCSYQNQTFRYTFSVLSWATSLADELSFTTIPYLQGYSCVDLLNAGMRESGVYYLQIRGTTYWFLKVYCEQNVADGGWTVRYFFVLSYKWNLGTHDAGIRSGIQIKF